MTGVGVRLEGTDAALAQLGGIVERVERPRGMWERIGMSLVVSTQRRFEEESAPDGSPWPPSVRALTKGGRTLTDTARLFQSISFNASDAGVEVGTNVVYGAIHQFGGEIKQGAREQVIHFKRNSKTGATRFAKANKRATFAQKAKVGPRTIKMPARPYLGIDEDDNRDIAAIAEDWLAGEGRAQ